MSQKVLDYMKPGVIYGDDLKKLFEICKSEGFALPAVNCVNTESVNGVLEAAAKVNSPVIIQFSNGGAALKGSVRSNSINSSAFGFNPVVASFLASF